MNKKIVSFLIPNRGGKDLDKVIKNINDIYSDLNKEIIVIQQEDNLPFMRGQLYNIGVKFSIGNYIALTDNDIYHFKKLPLFNIYDVFKKPIVGFKWISQVDYNNGVPIIKRTDLMLNGTGAFNFMGKNDFEKVNGFSNLYIGWGAEDIDFMLRFNNDYCRVPQNLGHLMHPHRADKNPKNRELNEKYCLSFNTRNFMKDGFKETIFNIVSDETFDTYRLIKVNGISVKEDFLYKDLLNKHYSIL